MLPTLLRCLRWKARLPTQGTIPFRPYVMIPKPGQAKSLHSSARASKKKTSSWKSTAFTYGCVIIVFTKMYFEDRFKPYNMVLSLYHKLNGALLHPSYQPIQSENEIRLLILEPGKGNEPIRCRLKNVLLSDKPKYEALSYVRGRCYGFMGQDYIYCEGQLVKIGKELSYALESLRLPDHERILWTDALCINQSDNVEKGHQVNIMGDIYSSSQKVLIWLGKASPSDGRHI
ncbi:hypothetical protein N7528_006850 [Penicillium herquei]|nr:hypothetical protein N7528_006850 [Penicillium herquei]